MSLSKSTIKLLRSWKKLGNVDGFGLVFWALKILNQHGFWSWLKGSSSTSRPTFTGVSSSLHTLNTSLEIIYSSKNTWRPGNSDVLVHHVLYLNLLTAKYWKLVHLLSRWCSWKHKQQRTQTTRHVGQGPRFCAWWWNQYLQVVSSPCRSRWRPQAAKTLQGKQIAGNKYDKLRKPIAFLWS